MTRRFGGLVAVDAVDLEVAQGGVTAVIGPNGAGKTTLFNMISGFQTPNAGRIISPARISPRGRPRRSRLRASYAPSSSCSFSRIFGPGEHPGRLPSSHKGGVLSALMRSRWRASGREIEARARELLDFVGLEGAADVEASALAYGQQRLLEIARALAAKPKLLMLDEPAAGLSADESKRLSAAIRGIAGRGTTVLLIEHDMKMVMNTADTIVVLDFGRKIAEGRPRGSRKSRRYRRLSRGGPCLTSRICPRSLSGIAVGCIYGLIGIGFCVIYNASGIVNFAQGAFVMLGGMIAYSALSAWLALPVAAAAPS